MLLVPFPTWCMLVPTHIAHFWWRKPLQKTKVRSTGGCAQCCLLTRQTCQSRTSRKGLKSGRRREEEIKGELRPSDSSLKTLIASLIIFLGAQGQLAGWPWEPVSSHPTEAAYSLEGRGWPLTFYSPSFLRRDMQPACRTAALRRRLTWSAKCFRRQGT